MKSSIDYVAMLFFVVSRKESDLGLAPDKQNDF